MKLRGAVTVIAVVSSVGLNLSQARADSPALAPDAKNYDQIFPLYAEECAFTQFSRKGEAPGGTGGHVALYLKGVCVDGSQGYPRIKLCDELANAQSLADVPKEKLQDPEWGVGVSVDKDFTNVNWVAVPTKSFFLHGKPNLLVKGKEGTPVVDQVALEQTIQAALPYFKGISGILPEESDPAKLINNAIGTDLAIDFARKEYCQRLPMGKESLQAMVDFLNKKQDDAHAKGNVWDGLANNCAHTAHNAIAATGVRNWLLNADFQHLRGIGRILVDVIAAPLMTLTNQIATPANEFITLSRLTTLDIHDMNPKSIYGDERRRALVMDPLYGSLPKELGSVAEIFPEVSQANNEFYVSPENPEEALIIMDFPPIDTIVSMIPGIGPKMAKKIDESGILWRHRNFKEITAADSIYRDAQARMYYFRDFYKKIQSKYLKKNPHPDDADFTAYFERYKSLIDERIAVIDASLNDSGSTAQTSARSE